MCGCPRTTVIAGGWHHRRFAPAMRRKSTPQKRSAELDEEICRRYAAGEEGPALATALGLPKPTIYFVLKRHGVLRRPRGRQALYARKPVCDLGDGSAHLDLGNGLVCRVDLADAEWLDQWRWRAFRPGTPRAYVVGGRPRGFMHRLILGLTKHDGLQADHLNFDGLDNRRSNLRIVTMSQNGQNRHTWASSGHRGVYLTINKAHPWAAEAKLQGIRYALGRYATEQQAIEVVVAWRREHMTHSVEFSDTV
jgi:hypothetical protein